MVNTPENQGIFVTRIAILDDYLHSSLTLADWSKLGERAEITVFDRSLGEEAVEALADFDIICTLRERQPFPADLIRQLPRLRYLCVTGKRYDTVDIQAAADCGIIVSNTPVAGAGKGAVTELTWGLILAQARHIASENRLMREGGWQHFVGNTLRGKKLGIVGLGGIGTEVARIGISFGMYVSAWSPNLTSERSNVHGVECVSKAALFADCDVISLHLALAPSTEGVVGKDEFALMKPSAQLVNTARAGLVDEAALLNALGTNQIASAALDVYSIEPLPEQHILRTLDNVLITPHLGYVTQEMLGAYYRYAIENISAYLDGRPMRVVS